VSFPTRRFETSSLHIASCSKILPAFSSFNRYESTSS
jgi:hypothetical protein